MKNCPKKLNGGPFGKTGLPWVICCNLTKKKGFGKQVEEEEGKSMDSLDLNSRIWIFSSQISDLNLYIKKNQKKEEEGTSSKWPAGRKRCPARRWSVMGWLTQAGYLLAVPASSSLIYFFFFFFFYEFKFEILDLKIQIREIMDRRCGVLGENP